MIQYHQVKINSNNLNPTNRLDVIFFLKPLVPIFSLSFLGLGPQLKKVKRSQLLSKAEIERLRNFLHELYPKLESPAQDLQEKRSTEKFVEIELKRKDSVTRKKKVLFKFDHSQTSRSTEEFIEIKSKDAKVWIFF